MTYEALRQEMSTPPCVIDHRPTFDVKLRSVLNRQALPELLIVTNECFVIGPAEAGRYYTGGGRLQPAFRARRAVPEA